jgi:hypothetical protein
LPGIQVGVLYRFNDRTAKTRPLHPRLENGFVPYQDGGRIFWREFGEETDDDLGPDTGRITRSDRDYLFYGIPAVWILG